MPEKDKSAELRLTRNYDATLEAVWEAWTDPVRLAQWWGPRGFTITTKHHDLRAGGTWIYTMHGPDGVDYPNKTIIHEVEKHDRHARLVYDHGGSDERPALFRVTVVFTEIDGKTEMQMTMRCPTPEAAIETKKFIKSAGGDATWDRLGEFLAPTDRFVINRTFEAPLETMFDVWTSPAHLSRWLPPTGFTMQFVEANIRAGGTCFSCMSGPNNAKMYGKTHYREVARPHRIVYTQSFCDADGRITRHPMSPTWPETMLTTVTFTAEGPTSTRVTIVWEVFGDATSVERGTFHDAKGSMTQGWTGSFDNLQAYLEDSSRLVH